MTCERRVSREVLTLAPKLNPMAVGLGLGLPLLGGDLIFYKQESMHTHSIKGRRRDPPPRGAAWEPLGVTHLESREISRTKGPQGLPPPADDRHYDAESSSRRTSPLGRDRRKSSTEARRHDEQNELKPLLQGAVPRQKRRERRWKKRRHRS